MASCTLGTAENKVIQTLKYLPGNPEHQMKHTVQTSTSESTSKRVMKETSPEIIPRIQNALIHWNTVKLHCTERTDYIKTAKSKIQ